jgi:hypothetical protein
MPYLSPLLKKTAVFQAADFLATTGFAAPSQKK